MVVLNQAPTAVAGATPLTVKEDKDVTFSSAGSGDTDGTITYSWNFGDSSALSSAPNPIHAYANPGTYTATLTVTDDNSATATDTVVITVQANQAPTAAANATPQSGTAPLSVSFSSASSADDGTIETYAWTFGDSGTSSLRTRPTPTPSGTYTATLTVTDDGGLTDSDSVSITVTAPIVDVDGDGVSPPTDCNDTNASIYPGAPDSLDGVDTNCDGVDGVATQNLYVTATGVDNGTCGALSTPCRQLAQASDPRARHGQDQGAGRRSGSYTAFTLTERAHRLGRLRGRLRQPFGHDHRGRRQRPRWCTRSASSPTT